MKSSLFALIPALLLQSPVYAQEHQGCWMINTAGRYIDLNGICQAQAQPQQNRSSGSSQQQDTNQSEVDRLGRVYAREYCDQRSAGRPDRESRYAASDFAFQGSSDGVNWGSVLDSGNTQAQELCPQLFGPNY